MHRLSSTANRSRDFEADRCLRGFGVGQGDGDEQTAFDPGGRRTRSKRLANLWPIFSRTPGIGGIPPELPAREPASPNTCVTLLTGGLLVRVQPEEPIFSITYKRLVQVSGFTVPIFVPTLDRFTFERDLFFFGELSVRTFGNFVREFSSFLGMSPRREERSRSRTGVCGRGTQATRLFWAVTSKRIGLRIAVIGCR